MSVAGKTAKSILENQFTRRKRLGRIAECGSGRCQRRDQRLRQALLFELFRQHSIFVVQNNPGHGLQQHAIIIRNLFEAPDEDAARLVQHLRFNARGNQTGDLVLQGLAVNRNVFVQNDELDSQPFHAPVGVRLDKLPHNLDLPYNLR